MGRKLSANAQIQKDKEERFRRIAETRTSHIIHDIQMLKKCAKTDVYAYSDEQVDAIFARLEQELADAKRLFSNRGRAFSITKEGTARITWDEIASKYPENRDEMAAEREREFVNDCFDAYEATDKLAATFWTPFEAYRDKIGQAFEVIRRVDEQDCDLCALPQWHIMLEDGTELDVYPEEIYEREQKANGRKL